MVSGFRATYYVYTGVESGLFEALVDSQTPSDLASQLGYHEPYVRRFCEIGLRWGLLSAKPHADDEENSANTEDSISEVPYTFHLREPFVKPLAVPDAAQYMGHLFRFMATQVSEDYTNYPVYFQTGETLPFADRDATFTDLIEGMTRGLQTIFVEKLVLESLPAFETQLSGGGRILDIGCGTGYLACRLCERYSNLSVVGVDLDSDAIERARERAEEAGVADRTTFRIEDGTTAATESTDRFDGAIFFMSLHEIAAENRDALFNGLGDNLTDDGVIVVFDEVYPEHPGSFYNQPFATGVETQWSELVWGNEVPTIAEQRDLFATAGVTEQSRTSFADQFVVYEGVSNNDG